MTKYEFLKELRKYLSDSMSGAEVEDSVRYYENYINEHIGNGESESKVIADLGDPRIIGKSIVDAAGRQKSSKRSEAAKGSRALKEDGQRRRTGAGNKLKLYGTVALVILVILVVLTAITKVIAFFFPLIVVIIVLTVIFRQTGGQR